MLSPRLRYSALALADLDRFDDLVQLGFDAIAARPGNVGSAFMLQLEAPTASGAE